MNVSCSHCNLEFPEEHMIKEEDLYFCCKGCQGVYHLINDKELNSYYSKVGNKQLSPPKENLVDSSTFDSESFKDEFVKELPNGNFQISLHIEGIHCSACVWLNEQILYETDGIIEANINFSTNRAKIVYDSSVIPLSRIIDTIRSIGYDASPFKASEQGKKLDRERRDYYIRLAVGIFGTMNIMWIAIALYTGYFTGIEQNMKTILNVAEWILATPVLFYSGLIFFKGAYFGLKNRVVNMDILVATGSLLTYIYSIYITVFELGEAYFDSVTMIITFILIGKFLELLSKRGISQSLDLIGKYRPTEVELLDGSKVSVKELKVGDVVVIRSGERVGVDGKVISGNGSFDESMITGESNPIQKTISDEVLSGTLLVDGFVQVETTKEENESHISRLVSMLEESMNKKPKIENLANSISGYFSIVILGLSLLTFLGWYFANGDFQTAFIISVSVLIIACPCALALATPIATLVGLKLGSNRGILFKEASFLETMAKADYLALDKTGTITEGKPEVVNFKQFGEFKKELLFSLLQTSKHPISIGVSKYLEEKNKELKKVEISDFKTHPAKGLEGKFGKIELLAGSGLFFQERGFIIPEFSEKSHLWFAIDGEIVALFELEDKIRNGAKENLEKIQKMGIKIHILSGDNQETVREVAEKIGVENWEANFRPEDKLDFIETKQREGKTVVMAGDGLNDVLALSTSNIGIAMGSGMDIAMEVGDVVLQKDNMETLYQSFYVSHRTFKLIKQNLGLSLLYNSITIPVAMAGFVIPLVASISMSLSSMIVVLNSLRVKST
jgi:Cu+-exporting ATPase